MFDLAWSEILLVAIVALLVVGPKDLPDLLRTVGRWARQARSMASNFQSTFDQMMRDDEMAKTREDINKQFSFNEPAKTPALPEIEKPDPAAADKAEAAEAEGPAESYAAAPAMVAPGADEVAAKPADAPVNNTGTPGTGA